MTKKAQVNLMAHAEEITDRRGPPEDQLSTVLVGFSG